MLYPLKFTPISKYRIWGGEKLNTVLNKGFKGDNIGESWEICDVKGDETQVANGVLTGKTLKELISEHQGDFVGNAVFKKFGNEFPLLIKFIDAKTPLSIQVHPSDDIAKQRHQSFGKNEMWYVMQADENAELIVGFDTKLNQATYQEYFEANKVLEVMHHEKIKKGDWTMIRDIQVKVAESNPRFGWINTDDLNDGFNRKGKAIKNDIHMSAEGYVIMGERFANKAIQLIESTN